MRWQLKHPSTIVPELQHHHITKVNNVNPEARDDILLTKSLVASSKHSYYYFYEFRVCYYCHYSPFSPTCPVMQTIQTVCHR